MTMRFPIGGGGGGGYYTNPVYVSTDQTIYNGGGGTTYTSPGYVTLGTGVNTTGGCITIPMDADRTGNARLTPDQMKFLLAEHGFMNMDNAEYCLLCFALDQYRTRAEHMYVIHEE